MQWFVTLFSLLDGTDYGPYNGHYYQNQSHYGANNSVSNCGFGENNEIIRSGDMYPKTSAITPIITPNSPNTTVGALVLCFWMFLALLTSLAFWTFLALWTFLELPPGWHGLPAV